MKDSEFIQELKKYQHVSTCGNVVFIMSRKQWTEFRRKFNSPMITFAAKFDGTLDEVPYEKAIEDGKQNETIYGSTNK